MISMADTHLPRSYGLHDETRRSAPPRAVLKGIGKALAQAYAPVVTEPLPHDLAQLVERLPGRHGSGRG